MFFVQLKGLGLLNMFLSESFGFVHLLNRKIRVIKVKMYEFLRFQKYLQVFEVSYPFPAFSPIFLDLSRNTAQLFWQIQGLNLWFLPYNLGSLLCISKTHVYCRNNFLGVSCVCGGREEPTSCGRHSLVPSPYSSDFTKTDESLELVLTLFQAVYQLPISRPCPTTSHF